MAVASENGAGGVRGGGLLEGTHRLALRLGVAAALIAPVVLRVALAVPFFRSGLTKWSGFLTLSPAAQYLFESQFQLHLFGRTFPFPAPDLVAYIDAVAEVVLPALLVLGLATRFSAFGLLIMTVVIQLTVPAGWANFHLPWAGLALGIMTLGPGPLSLDRVLDRWVRRRHFTSS
jgi:putative oxidoreductase